MSGDCRVLFLCGIMLCGLLSYDAVAQPFPQPFQPTPAIIAELDPAGIKLLDRAEKLAAETPPTDAVEALLQVIERQGTQLVRVPPRDVAQPSVADGFATYWPADRWGGNLVRTWNESSPAAARMFRQFVDRPLDDALAAARETKEIPQLQKSLERFGGGTSASTGWLLLGELWLDQGAMTAARLAFSNAAEAANTSDAQAAAFARLAYTAILQRDTAAADRYLDELRKISPPPIGKLNGSEGPWIELLVDFRQKLPAAFNAAASEWKTFASRSQRDGQPLPSVPIELAAQPRWKIPLPRIDGGGDVLATGRKRLAEENAALTAYHPLVRGETIFVRQDAAGQSTVRALSWQDGRELWRFEQELPLPEDRRPVATKELVSDAERLLPPHVGVTRYTFSSTGEAIFARLGSPVTAPATRKLNSVRSKDQGWLVGLDLTAQGRPLEGFPLYPEATDWAFEGTPLVDAGRFYVLQSRRDGTRRQLHIACFSRLTTPVDTTQGNSDGRARGRLLWRTFLASADTIGGGDVEELSHNLLSRVDNRLLVNSNLGVVAAVDAEQGLLQWLTRYPRAAFSANPKVAADLSAMRDLAPPVIAGQQVVFAPADCTHVFACDLGSGTVSWKLPVENSQKIVHLLGIHERFLIATGATVMWISLENGQIVAEYRPENVTPMGRGLLTQQGVLWPLRTSIQVLPLTLSRTEISPSHVIDLTKSGMTGGNLVAAPRGLLIASGTHLSAFDEAEVEK